MAPSVSRFLVYLCTLGVVIFTGVHGRTIQLTWTADGVRNYTSSPLRVDLGDMLRFTCTENISNLFIQTDRIQYDNCNASAGSGLFNYNGLCYNGNPAFLTLTENSQSLDNTVKFVNNQVYFLTSYSEGSFRGNDRTFTSGGQCEDGLKMIIVIGVANVPSVDGTAPDATQPPTPNNQGLTVHVQEDMTTSNGLATKAMTTDVSTSGELTVYHIIPLYIITGALVAAFLLYLSIEKLARSKIKCMKWPTDSVPLTPGPATQPQPEPLYAEATVQANSDLEKIEMKPNVLYGKCEPQNQAH